LVLLTVLFHGRPPSASITPGGGRYRDRSFTPSGEGVAVSVDGVA
jgi:hypothetical protein